MHRGDRAAGDAAGPVFCIGGSPVRLNRLKNERGASAVEFAIVASLLFMILFGIITFGITFNRVQGLQASGREGARLGALTSTTRNDILERVQNSVSIINGQANIAANCAQNPPTGLAEDKGCIDVFVRHDASGTCPGSGCTEYTLGTSTPCGAPPASATAPAVVVFVFYKIKLDIPLWSSPTMVIRGTGEFRCEQ